jgi:hypothetical protein
MKSPPPKRTQVRRLSETSLTVHIDCDRSLDPHGFASVNSLPVGETHRLKLKVHSPWSVLIVISLSGLQAITG